MSNFFRFVNMPFFAYSLNSGINSYFILYFGVLRHMNPDPILIFYLFHLQENN